MKAYRVNTYVQMILLCLSLWGMFIPYQTSFADEDTASSFPQTKLQLLPQKISPYSKVRVKIFPHDRDYKPHGLDKNKTQISFVSNELCHVFEGQRQRPAKAKKAMFASREVTVDLKMVASHPLWIECGKPVTLIREAHLPHFTYPGSFYVHKVVRGDDKYLEVVNVVALRDYVKGVVPTEVYPGWPMETLKTQAVAARTYAIFHYVYSHRYARSRYWDVDDTIAFQAYTGNSLRTPRTDQAVIDTEGQILMHGREVIQAYYHADSAGKTESAWNVWKSNIPYVGPIQEFFHEEQEPTQWSKEISLKNLNKRLRSARVLTKKEEIINLSVPVIGRTESGRVRLVTLILKNGEFKNVSVPVIRRAVGSLPSTLFTFEADEKSQDKLWIRGQGNGHGVGMSQKGASYLAGSKNWTYDRILDFYYLDTTLCRLGKSQGSIPDCYQHSRDLAAEQLSAKKRNAS
ncbi:MAG: SpoIID/LytB domain-containing protein [Oligoflexus sp.]